MFKLPKRRNRKSKKSGRYPTTAWGPSAQAELVKRIPVFNQASKRVRIPYYDYGLTRTGTAGAIATYFFSANGCYDPDITGTGHQPLGFDTMMLYYEQFTVIRSKITATVLNNGANAIRVGLSLTPDTTAPVIGTLVENGEIVMKVADAPAYPTGAGNGGNAASRVAILSLACDCQSYFGRTGNQRELLDDTSLSGTAAANPSEQVYFALSTWGAFFNDNTTVAFDVVIDYDVVFWEPRKLAQQFKIINLDDEPPEEEKRPDKTVGGKQHLLVLKKCTKPAPH